jgi:hypothetical protein
MAVETIILLCVAVLIGGLGLLLLGGGILSILQGFKAARWPAVQGVILSSRLEEKRTHTVHANEGRPVDEVGYQPQVEYEYRVGGTIFKGTRISPLEKQYARRAGQKVVDRYPAGAAVKVFTDPDNPNQALLETGVAGSSLIFLLTGLLLLGGAVIFAAGIAR